MDKLKFFKDEIEYVGDDNVKKSLKVMIEKLPDYFFEVAASSTGKYHPEYALGDGGLLRHTKAAVRIAHELLENPIIGGKYLPIERDLMIMALILHDGLKHGMPMEKYVKFEHPLLMANYIEDNKNELFLDNKNLELLKSTISSHMGPWTTDYNGNDILPKPSTKYQSFVHMCDYLASRKSILFKFDTDNNIIG